MAGRRYNSGTCSAEGCDRGHYAKGFCTMHYSRLRSGDSLECKNRKKGDPPHPCSVPGCKKPGRTRRLCAMHHQRFLRTGDAGAAAQLKATPGTRSLLHCGKRQCPAASKLLMHLYNIRNREKLKRQNQRWRERFEAENPGVLKAISRARYVQNVDSHKAQVRAWQAKNWDRVKAIKARSVAKRREHIARATPSWVNWAEIDRIYETCPKGWHVDHVIPLQGENVCGLHTHTNLQHLPASENCSKRNSFSG